MRYGPEIRLAQLQGSESRIRRHNEDRRSIVANYVSMHILGFFLRATTRRNNCINSMHLRVSTLSEGVIVYI